MAEHKLVERTAWIKHRKELLVKEKELTKLRDDIARQRRALPWVKIDNQYTFEDGSGQWQLIDLFGSRRQLMIYHFMYGPEWDAGCTSCTFWADNFSGTETHLAHRDISFVAASSAPYKTLAAYALRFGWTFRWLSTNGSSFNQDFGVAFDQEAKKKNQINYNYCEQNWYMDELPGVSVFIRDDDDVVYHTYSTYSRGLDGLNGAYNYIDLSPLGRNEEDGMSWLRRRDEYKD